MELREKKILVTGANGFVGSHVVDRLLERGVKVRALIRKPDAKAELESKGAEIMLGEFNNERWLRDAASGVQAVVHCIGTGVPDKTESFSVNAEITEKLLDAALRAGCQKFVHISTTSVYDLAGLALVNEDTPATAKDSVYAESKAEADRLVVQAMQQGLSCTILRPAPILGSHASSVWGNKVPRAIAAGKFPIVGDGLGQFPYVHVESLVEAIVKSLESEDASGEIINLVDGHSTWRRYVDHFRKSELQSIPEGQAPARLSSRAEFSNEKARRVLNHQPKYTFEEAMEESSRFLLANP